MTRRGFFGACFAAAAAMVMPAADVVGIKRFSFVPQLRPDNARPIYRIEWSDMKVVVLKGKWLKATI